MCMSTSIVTFSPWSSLMGSSFILPLVMLYGEDNTLSRVHVVRMIHDYMHPDVQGEGEVGWSNHIEFYTLVWGSLVLTPINMLDMVLKSFLTQLTLP